MLKPVCLSNVTISYDFKHTLILNLAILEKKAYAHTKTVCEYLYQLYSEPPQSWNKPSIKWWLDDEVVAYPHNGIQIKN